MRLTLAAAAVALASLTTAAAAQAAPTPTDPVDLSDHRAEKRVVDVTLPPQPPKARAAAARNEQFTDAQGRRFTISTDIPDVELKRFADILAATAHGAEITQLRVNAVRRSDMARACRNDEAVACYAPDDAQRSFAGQLWFAVDDPDVVHTLVHEYGHHVDNQLLNLGHLGACSFANDGSRNWFFERELEDNILGEGIGCSRGTEWQLLLGELFAEDYVQLNGIQGWVLPTFRPPSRTQLEAMAFDMQERFNPTRERWSPDVPARRQRVKRVRLRSFTFLEVRLTGARGSDVDLIVRRASGRKQTVVSSRRKGRVERVQRVLPPGTYEVVVRSRRGGGRSRATIYEL